MDTALRSANRKAVFALATVCLVAIAAALFEYLAAARTIRSLEIARAHFSATEARLRNLKSAAREDLRSVIELQNAAHEIEKKQAQPRVLQAAYASSQEAGRRLLAAHPEDLRMLNVLLEHREQARLGAALRAVGCREDQIKQAVQLGLRNRENGFHIIIDGISLPGTGDLSPAEVQDQLKALIGDAGYTKFRQYSQDDLARGLTAQVADMASWSGPPLTREQGEALRQIVARHRLDWDVGAILQEGGTVLSQRQMDALKTVAEAQRAVIESNRYAHSLFDAEYKNTP